MKRRETNGLQREGERRCSVRMWALRLALQGFPGCRRPEGGQKQQRRSRSVSTRSAQIPFQQEEQRRARAGKLNLTHQPAPLTQLKETRPGSALGKSWTRVPVAPPSAEEGFFLMERWGCCLCDSAGKLPHNIKLVTEKHKGPTRLLQYDNQSKSKQKTGQNLEH